MTEKPLAFIFAFAPAAFRRAFCRATLRAFRALALTLAAASMVAAAPAEVMVTMETSKGNIVLSINEKRAPRTAQNFLRYVRDGFYNGLIFHRVIPGVIIQGGGFNTKMKPSETREPIKFERTRLSNKKYTIAMARRTDDPDSATSQFFINIINNKPLDGVKGIPGYAVFGKVVGGEDVVDAIAGVKTGFIRGIKDVPIEQVVIKSVKLGGAATKPAEAKPAETNSAASQ